MKKKFYEYQGKEHTIDEICKIAERSKVSFYKCLKKGWTISQIMDNKPTHYIRHGLKGTKLYNTWKSIKRRCYNANYEYYKDYGARGIILCDEWRFNFKTFYDWAMNSGYKEGLTIDRIDNNKGYSPDNCHWVDYSTQNNNQRRSIRLKYNDEWLSIRRIAQIENVSYKTAYKRYVLREKTKLPIKRLYEECANESI